MSDLDEQLGLIDDQSKITGVNLGKNSRPTFLTVICILAFIGNGLGIFQGLIGMAMVGMYRRIFSTINALGQQSGNPLGFDIDSIFNAYNWFAILLIFGSLLALTGSILMWKLKKIGFPFYVIGQILPIAGIFLFASTIFNGPFIGFSILMTFMSTLFPIAFMIMFAINIKHLKQ